MVLMGSNFSCSDMEVRSRFLDIIARHDASEADRLTTIIEDFNTNGGPNTHYTVIDYALLFRARTSLPRCRDLNLNPITISKSIHDITDLNKANGLVTTLISSGAIEYVSECCEDLITALVVSNVFPEEVKLFRKFIDLVVKTGDDLKYSRITTNKHLWYGGVVR